MCPGGLGGLLKRSGVAWLSGGKRLWRAGAAWVLEDGGAVSCHAEDYLVSRPFAGTAWGESCGAGGRGGGATEVPVDGGCVASTFRRVDRRLEATTCGGCSRGSAREVTWVGFVGVRGEIFGGGPAPALTHDRAAVSALQWGLGAGAVRGGEAGRGGWLVRLGGGLTRRRGLPGGRLALRAWGLPWEGSVLILRNGPRTQPRSYQSQAAPQPVV